MWGQEPTKILESEIRTALDFFQQQMRKQNNNGIKMQQHFGEVQQKDSKINLGNDCENSYRKDKGR